MNIFKDVKSLWNVLSLISKIREGKMDIKSWAGIVKIVTYVAAAAALILGYTKPETVVTVTLILSAVVKLTEAIVAATPSKEDDAKVAEVVAILKDKGLIK